MDLQLGGRSAVVTGGSRGIGKAIARCLAMEGVDVAVVGRDRAALDASAAEIAAASGRKVVGVAGDTGDEASVKAMAAEATGKLGGRVDILVNCAAKPGGQGKPPRYDEVSKDELFDHVNVKVMGYLRTAQAFAPGMKAAGFGRIVNVSGLAARTTGTIVGSIRNVAVQALTKNLADELAGTGITVTCVHPGLIRTEKTPGVIQRMAAAEGVSEAEVEKRLNAGNLVGRLITADDIAYVVTMLASPRSIALNGDVIAAGGGTRSAIHY